MSGQTQVPLLDQIVNRCRALGYARNTAKSYRRACEAYIRWHRQQAGEWRHPAEMGRDEITQYLSWMAVTADVAPSTQNSALQAILFMYHQVLKIEIAGVDSLRAKRPKRIPVVLSRSEVSDVLGGLSGQSLLIAELLYGCGLRISEAVSLRVKDLDFANSQITIRAAKGAKDRVVQLPKSLVEKLRKQIEVTESWHRDDTRRGLARVELPYAFARKSPSAASQLGWYWLFCSRNLSRCPETKQIGRHHVHAGNFARMLAGAVRKARIYKRVTPHVLRHSYATHMINQGVDIATIAKLMGHADVRVTMVYLHVDCGSAAATAASPLDRLAQSV